MLHSIDRCLIEKRMALEDFNAYHVPLFVYIHLKLDCKLYARALRELRINRNHFPEDLGFLNVPAHAQRLDFLGTWRRRRRWWRRNAP